MPQNEFSLRCTAPIASATWIFDVTDRLPWLCESVLFIALPSTFDWPYSADASFTLLFHASDNRLYEAISEPMRVYLDSQLHLVRAISYFDTSRLPDVFRAGEVEAKLAQSSNGRHRAVSVSLKLPICDETRRHLPLLVAQTELHQLECDRSAAHASSAERERIAQREQQAEQERIAQRERQAEEARSQRRAEQECAEQELASERSARQLARAQRKALAEVEETKRLEKEKQQKQRRVLRENKLARIAFEKYQRLESEKQIIDEKEKEGKLSETITKYLESDDALRLHLQCPQHDAEKIGAVWAGTRGRDARWYAPSLSWLWEHWNAVPAKSGRMGRGKKPTPLVRPALTIEVSSALRMAFADMWGGAQPIGQPGKKSND